MDDGMIPVGSRHETPCVGVDGWAYDHDTGEVRDDDGELIAVVDTGHKPHGLNIAAAPELLAALEEMVATLQLEMGDNIDVVAWASWLEPLNTSLKAIREAKGQ